MSAVAWVILGMVLSFMAGAMFVTVRLANVLQMSLRELMILLLAMGKSDPEDD